MNSHKYDDFINDCAEDPHSIMAHLENEILQVDIHYNINSKSVQLG